MVLMFENEYVMSFHIISFNKMYLKMLFVQWHPFCLGLNVLKLHPFKISPSQSHREFNSSEILPDSRGPSYLHRLTLIPEQISNYIHYKALDEIIYHFQTLPVQLLKSGNGEVILYHTILGMWLLNHVGIKVNLCYWKIPLMALTFYLKQCSLLIS